MGHGEKKCCLAPERFYTPKKEEIVQSKLTPAMDTFSLGCVLIELFLNGEAALDLGDLMEYRRMPDGNSLPLSLKQKLDKIESSKMRAACRHMLSLDPEARLSPNEVRIHVFIKCRRLVECLVAKPSTKSQPLSVSRKAVVQSQKDGRNRNEHPSPHPTLFQNDTATIFSSSTDRNTISRCTNSLRGLSLLCHFKGRGSRGRMGSGLLFACFGMYLVSLRECFCSRQCT
jgi:serine/threonine protein kinase